MFEASWIGMVSFIEFAYINSYQTTTQIALFETLYKRKYISPLHQDKIGENDALTQALRPKITQKIIEKIRLIKERMKQTKDH